MRLSEELIGYATKGHKNGLVSLENEALEVQGPFLRKALTLAVDGTDFQEIHNMMPLEIDMAESRATAGSKVFECAGGYSPTVGIIGAVMGLIQVMKNLANVEEVGHGIAMAFAPVAARSQQDQVAHREREGTQGAEAVVAIAEGF